MSRIGKIPVKIPVGVKVSISGNKIIVEGPKGRLEQEFIKDIKIEAVEGKVTFSASKEDKKTMALWGLYRSLVANMIEGVTEGFKKSLEIVGVGYRAAQKGLGVSISVGYSNPIEFRPPQGVQLAVEDSTKIHISGINKQAVGLTAAKIRSIRKPEPYKGKGIRYLGEQVRRKAGKAAGAKTA
ncbi:50S ribosomal protein L6 [candidate division WWE3 bacterium]|nr:50S ribosomal protein L6 [candidate division WWE3 bacterium]